ncbi:MAG: hypothetical protein JWQ40_514 [Segetibacter sp.]|nr:hypothetical protein [Segetibacter sp.]
MKMFFLIVMVFIGSTSVSGQIVHRTFPAVRTTQKIVIDAVLDDSAWTKAPLATGFVEFKPNIGKHEDEKNKTEVWILYDDNAIYVAGFCHESSRDSLSTDLVGRDVVGANDFVGVLFDTYHDEINGFGYYVTPLGEQYDAKYSSNGEDDSWNSVYFTEAKIVEGGWKFEMRIPYSAIRFGNKSHQDWGINIIRRRNKSGQQFMWNPINPVINGLFNQAGIWKGIENVKVPLRLSFSPYLSTYANHYPYNQPGVKNWSSSINGGMDVKYGINQSFTLDMTLIPDFGQVQSDNKVLNLTPFEVKYNEYRTFFTEGTELFSKGNLFYSRRIGGTPLHYYDAGNQINSNERIVANPSETRLINATKISGRTASGLGVGVFNAITNAQYAIVEDNNKVQRKIETNPLTNYSIVVLDQALKHNSSISFINTNVMRSGGDYDANVAAALFDIYDKNVNYNVWGKVGVSQLFGYKPDKGTLNGYNHNLSFGKMKGNLTWSLSQNLADRNYQQNDMGYFTNNNYLNHYSWVGYKILKPKNFYNNLYFNINTTYNRRFNPGTSQNVFVNVNVNGQMKNLWNVGIAYNVSTQENDFWEPRIEGKVFKRPYFTKPAAWIYTNAAKKYSLGIDGSYTSMPEYKAKGFDIQFNEQFRFNKKLTISNSANLEYKNRNIGFAAVEGERSIFGLRKRHTVENIFSVKYNFNNKMGITFRTRHYWSKVDYSEFFDLNNDGSLKSTTTVSNNPNSNVNFFNVDMVYTWQFSQGSFINIVWKDASSTFSNNVDDRYFKNFSNTWSEPQLNSLSLRIIYFLDYLSLKGKK